MVTRSQNHGMLDHPGAISRSLLHGWSCNFSTTCPRRLLVGRHVGPDPPTVDWGPLLPGLVDLELVRQRYSCCWTWWQKVHLRLVPPAVYCLKTLEGGTILFEWSVLAWIACLRSHSASCGCVRLWVTCFWYTRSGFSARGHKEGPISPPFIQTDTMGLSVAMTAI